MDKFHVSAVINTGIAGSLRNEINIGDIVAVSYTHLDVYKRQILMCTHSDVDYTEQEKV